MTSNIDHGGTTPVMRAHATSCPICLKETEAFNKNQIQKTFIHDVFTAQLLLKTLVSKGDPIPLLSPPRCSRSRLATIQDLRLRSTVPELVSNPVLYAGFEHVERQASSA